MMIAVVEDDANDSKALTDLLVRYEKEKEMRFTIRTFSDGQEFLDNYKPEYDLIFLDVEMPHLDGLESARRIRSIDEKVLIIFVTRMVQYAIQGYEVEAYDYLIKPLNPEHFHEKLDKVFSYLKQHLPQPELVVYNEDNDLVRVFANSILYIEKEKNYTLFHASDGKVYKRREKLAKSASLLQEEGFSQINSGCLVNMSYVDVIAQMTVTVAGNVLPLARRRKQAFVSEYMKFLSGKANDSH